MTSPSDSLNPLPSSSCFAVGSNPNTLVVNVFGRSLSDDWKLTNAEERGVSGEYSDESRMPMMPCMRRWIWNSDRKASGWEDAYAVGVR